MQFKAYSPAKRSIISVRRRLTLELSSDIILFLVAFVVLLTIEYELYILHISLIIIALNRFVEHPLEQHSVCRGRGSAVAETERERERVQQQDRVPRGED